MKELKEGHVEFYKKNKEKIDKALKQNPELKTQIEHQTIRVLQLTNSMELENKKKLCSREADYYIKEFE